MILTEMTHSRAIIGSLAIQANIQTTEYPVPKFAVITQFYVTEGYVSRLGTLFIHFLLTHALNFWACMIVNHILICQGTPVICDNIC